MYNKKQLNEDLLDFFRRIKLKAYFKDSSEKNKDDFHIKSKNKWTPTKNHHTIDTFIEAVNNDLCNIPTQKLPRDNLSKNERCAIETLKNNNDIIISNADKGGAVVIMNTEDYNNEALRQLNDPICYKELENDPTKTHTGMVVDALDHLKVNNKLSVKLADSLIPDTCRTPQFYLLPKIHKKNNPGRPVISSINCHTSRISEFVDHHLQPHVKNLKSYVKDTTHFLNLINDIKSVPPEAHLVTMDVRSLYTNIPHNEGIQAVKETMDNSNDSSKTTMITKLLTLILTLNNFTFNNKHYLQLKGCTMGTKCATTYANIFMGKFEDEYIQPIIKDYCKLYVRYIDDIFLIWTGTQEQFHATMNIINASHDSIKFDYQISKKEVNFLDTTVFITEKLEIKTKLFVKPTDRQSYLHKKSEHPNSLKNSIPYGQALRIKKICSQDEDYTSNIANLKNAFLKRGYREDHIDEQISKASDVNRKQLLSNQHKTQQVQRIPLVLTYNRTLPDIQNILQKHWPILQLDPGLKPIFQEHPILAYRRNKSIGDMLRRRNTSQEVRRGQCKACTTDKRLKCCKQITETASFTSTQTGRTFQIFHDADCKTKHVIYLLECIKCQLQYVGKSESPFHFRMAQYRSDIKKSDCIEAAKHFQSDGHQFHQHGKFTIIEKIEKNMNKEQLTLFMEKREDFWMSKLKTLHPLGLNRCFNHPQLTTGIMR